jgi:adenosylcobinamide-phosphate synthase
VWPRTSVALGIVADLVFGEPPVRPHPVAAFGSVMSRFEARAWRDDRAAGVVHALAGLGLGTAFGLMARSTAMATYTAVAGNALGRAALDVHDALVGGDVDRARELVPALVGRDPSSLDAAALARAAVESVAENTVDAVVAPALWAAALGAPGALGYRAVNTMDAMVGHRSPRYERYGWASARLDDVANLVPARVTALLVAAVRPGAAGGVWRAVREDAPAHPSPNSGVAEAAFAAALGVSVGGGSVYGGRVEHRPALGGGRPVEVDDIPRAVRLSRDVSLALSGALLVSGCRR